MPTDLQLEAWINLKLEFARDLDETNLHEMSITGTDAKILEVNTKLLLEKAAASANRASHLRGQGCGISMLLQNYADDLFFVQLEDATLKHR